MQIKPYSRSLRVVVGALACSAAFGVGLAEAATIIKGPYLQNVTPTSIVVMWETDVASDSRVDFGVAAPTESSVADPANVTIHEVALTTLLQNTRYVYTVTSADAASTSGTFITAPGADVPYRFAVYGDTRSNPQAHTAVINSMIPHDPDFVLHVGDFVADGRIYSEWGPYYFTPAAPLLKNVPLFGVLGNHEYYGSERMWYFDFFAPPDNDSTLNKEHWYAFTYGCARFIGLNACEGGDSFLPGSEQYQWLVNELNSPAFQNAKWQFVWTHNPPYTSKEQDNSVDVNMRAYLVPLFEQYGVDVVFSGDDHFYRHSLRNGIHYIITGGGGAPLHDVGTPMAGATLISAESTYEHCIVDLIPSRFDFYASRTDGSLIDSFTLNYSTAPPVPSGLTASAGNAQVSLNWNTSSGATGYNVKRATVSGGPYDAVASVSANSYLDTGVINGTTYYYVVSALNATGESLDSSEVSATPAVPPPATPTGLTATAGDAQVSLSWNISSGATSYNVKRATRRNGPYGQIASVESPNYIDGTVLNGTTYFYVVTAVNSSGESAASSRVSATPQGPPAIPAAPAHLTARSGPRTGQIKLSWDASSGATSYNVKRSLDAGGPYVDLKTGVASTSYIDGDLASGLTYYYVVSAENAAGESPNSDEAAGSAK